jgi:hypothetical protein
MTGFMPVIFFVLTINLNICNIKKSTRRRLVIDLIKKIFADLNQFCFSNKIIMPEFQLDVVRKFNFRWISDDEVLCIGSASIDMNKREICVAMLHEMIHMYNYSLRIQDVNENQYHNKKFMNMAINLGLGIFKDKNQGWSITTLDQSNDKDVKIDIAKNKELINYIEKINIDTHKLSLDYNAMRESIASLKPSKVFFLKYECRCPAPFNSIRSGRRPDGNNAPEITCERCKSKFTCVSPLDD